jgi:hypothetical protein
MSRSRRASRISVRRRSAPKSSSRKVKTVMPTIQLLTSQRRSTRSNTFDIISKPRFKAEYRPTIDYLHVSPTLIRFFQDVTMREHYERGNMLLLRPGDSSGHWDLVYPCFSESRDMRKRESCRAPATAITIHTHNYALYAPEEEKKSGEVLRSVSNPPSDGDVQTYALRTFRFGITHNGIYLVATTEGLYTFRWSPVMLDFLVHQSYHLRDYVSTVRARAFATYLSDPMEAFWKDDPGLSKSLEKLTGSPGAMNWSEYSDVTKLLEELNTEVKTLNGGYTDVEDMVEKVARTLQLRSEELSNADELSMLSRDASTLLHTFADEKGNHDVLELSKPLKLIGKLRKYPDAWEKVSRTLTALKRFVDDKNDDLDKLRLRRSKISFHRHFTYLSLMNINFLFEFYDEYDPEISRKLEHMIKDLTPEEKRTYLNAPIFEFNLYKWPTRGEHAEIVIPFKNSRYLEPLHDTANRFYHDVLFLYDQYGHSKGKKFEKTVDLKYVLTEQLHKPVENKQRVEYQEFEPDKDFVYVDTCDERRGPPLQGDILYAVT